MVIQNTTQSASQDEHVKKQTRGQLNVTVPIRFDQGTVDLLRDTAREKGIGVTTLIRMWTLDRLKRANKTNKKRP